MAAASHSLPRERALVPPRPWGSLQDMRKTWNLPGKQLSPKPAVHAARPSISAELLLAVRQATAAFLEPQQAHRRP